MSLFGRDVAGEHDNVLSALHDGGEVCELEMQV